MYYNLIITLIDMKSPTYLFMPRIRYLELKIRYLWMIAESIRDSTNLTRRHPIFFGFATNYLCDHNSTLCEFSNKNVRSVSLKSNID